VTQNLTKNRCFSSSSQDKSCMAEMLSVGNTLDCRRIFTSALNQVTSYCVLRQTFTVNPPAEARVTLGQNAALFTAFFLSSYNPDSSSYSSFPPPFLLHLGFLFFYLLSDPEPSFSDWFQTCHWALLADSTFHSWRLHTLAHTLFLTPFSSSLPPLSYSNSHSTNKTFFHNKTPKSLRLKQLQGIPASRKTEMHSEARVEGKRKMFGEANELNKMWSLPCAQLHR